MENPLAPGRVHRRAGPRGSGAANALAAFMSRPQADAQIGDELYGAIVWCPSHVLSDEWRSLLSTERSIAGSSQSNLISVVADPVFNTQPGVVHEVGFVIGDQRQP
jgi:hypothetical protein